MSGRACTGALGLWAWVGRRDRLAIVLYRNWLHADNQGGEVGLQKVGGCL